MKPMERNERVAELKALKPVDFVLRARESYCQDDIELWSEAMADVNLTGTNLNLPRVRRMAFQAAYKGGWFDKKPELEDGDFVLLPPSLVTRMGDTVLELYNEITIPDLSFT